MQIDQTISHYKILQEIGQGGMGIVYKAQDTRLQRTVALKVLRPRVVGDPDLKNRFLREARTASLLNHTNITTIYDIDEWQGQDYIVMEYVEGKTLKKAIMNDELSMMNVVEYAVQICEALREAHEHNIIHRDIKSGNIMITPLGRVKVMDFGLAKMAGSMTQSKIRTTMGTLAYMSPEQMRGDPLDFRTDIWSLGVVLYEMITRNLPFKGDYEQALLYAVLHKEPEKISALRPDVPPALERIVYKTLAKKKEERFVSTLDMANELRSVFELKKLTRSKKLDEQKVDAGKARKIKRTLSTKKGGLFISLTVALVIIVFAVVIKTNRKKAIQLSQPIVTRLTSNNLECYPALSADGSRLAFSWVGGKGDNADIYIKIIGEEGHTQLTSDSASEICPTWSNDGNYIAFIRYGENAGIYSESSIGGREIKRADISQKTKYNAEAPPRVDWSSDGQFLVFNDYDSLRRTSCLFRLHLDSGEREQMTFPESGLAGDMNPKFSPDGKRVAFARAYGHRIRELYLLNLKNGALKQLTHDKKHICDLAWTADGKKIVFVSNRKGISRLWSVGIHGGHSRPLNIGSDDIATISIARNAHRLVYATWKSGSDIWQAEIPGDSGFIKPHRLITSPYWDYFPVYSPDEKEIAFQSDRSGNFEIYVCNRKGSHPRRITSSETHSGAPRWSPCGKYIIFDSESRGNGDIKNSDIIKVDIHNINRTVNLTDHPADDCMPSWSRDGRSIYFGSKRSENYQIYKMSADGGEPRQITKNGGFFGFESFDSAYLFYRKFIQGTGHRGPIHRINLITLEESVAIEENVWPFQWSVEKEGVYYIAPDKDDNPILKLYHQDTERVEKIGTLEKWFSFWDVSNDGTHILLWRIENVSGDIYMVDDFHW